ncbi:hypothetical protein GCM10009609_44940 [Pseudonocardia aurantiaca]|uniref:Haemin-degrading HemS/ChuX domain-containing protein n=1 Tax=Pseudonocardia aurantiaca TaxID=75290 RepID=A0ABW4FGD6_9PSEU
MLARLTGPNIVPAAYRGVSVARTSSDLDAEGLRAHLVGREAYRRTRFIVVHSPGGTSLLHVAKRSNAELFSPITEVELLAGIDDCEFVREPEADTAVPSALAEVAGRRAPGARAVVVEGRYEHVSFIVDPRPLRIRVREVVPPLPAKLHDQASRVLATAEELPPISLVPELVQLTDLAATHPAPHYLLPCRGSGASISGATTSYLDERPADQAWTLIGCARSEQIHHWFYGRDVTRADLCPLRTARLDDGSEAGLLTKCCLREDGAERGDGWISVPWGSTLDQVRQALAELATQREPSWARV